MTGPAPQKLEADDAAGNFLRDVLKLDAFYLEFGGAQVKGVFPHGGLFLYPQGFRLIEQGTESRDVFVVYEGKIEVIRPFVQQQIFLGRGDICGEMSIVRDGKRNATVIVSEPSKIFFLPFHDFQYVMDNNPAIAEHFKNLAYKRL